MHRPIAACARRKILDLSSRATESRAEARFFISVFFIFFAIMVRKSKKSSARIAKVIAQLVQVSDEDTEDVPATQNSQIYEEGTNIDDHVSTPPSSPIIAQLATSTPTRKRKATSPCRIFFPPMVCETYFILIFVHYFTGE